MAAVADLSFGKNYAILNLDLMIALVDMVKNTSTGQKFISNCSHWIEAVHKKRQRPLTVFTSLSLSLGERELSKNSPFANLVEAFGSFTIGSAGVQIAPNFIVDEHDIILQKTRWYAGTSNSLEQLLKAQNIKTVIIVSY